MKKSFSSNHDGRRHSVQVYSADAKKFVDDKLFGLSAPSNEVKNKGRRHSVMVLPSSKRRVSINLNPMRLSNAAFTGFIPTSFTGLIPSPRPRVEMENTYKTNPDDDQKFCSAAIRSTVEMVLDRLLPEQHMDHYLSKDSGLPRIHAALPSERGLLAKDLAGRIRENLKSIQMARYKFVVNVFLGDCAGQRLLIASRSLWDEDTDGHVTVQRKTSSCFAVVVVHAVYFP